MGQNTIFIVSNIFIAFWLLVFAKFQDHFSKPEIYSTQISILKSDLEVRQFELELYKEHMHRFQLEVASLVPQAIKKIENEDHGYPLRNLASVLPGAKNNNLEISMHNSNFLLAKNHFRDGKYKLAIEKFNNFIERTPYSIHLVEANFLLAESFFQIEDFENCLLIIERMIEQFPSSEMTGYSMIRMGKIYELQDRPEEAVEIYKIVSQSFADRGIASQAAESMRNVEL